MNPLSKNHRSLAGREGFSLIEVVLALGLTSFALLTMLGLFTVGLKDVNESERKVEAANAMGSILEARLAAPVKVSELDVLPAIDPQSLPLRGTAYISASGRKVGAGDARFQLTYEIWPDSGSPVGSPARLVRLHLLASWPAGAAPEKSMGTSEVLTSAYVKR